MNSPFTLSPLKGPEHGKTFMEVITTNKEMQTLANQLRAEGKRIAFVPTMGALHKGHMRLVQKAAEVSDVVIVSDFVNPKQFNDADDLNNYPRDLKKDQDLCEKEGVTYFFAPEADEIYPPGYLTSVNVAYLSKQFEGESRPGHFRGVCTVVLKLLNITKPHVMLLGYKDAQQFTILQHMVDDLCVDVELMGVATARDKDGMALSSRNVLLSKTQREQALCMNRALKRVHFLIKKQGILHAGELMSAIRSTIDGADVELDYAAIVNRTTFEPLDHVVHGGTFVILAIKVGNVHLIDNTRI